MKNGSPSYIIITPHGYHFRLKIPSDLRNRLGNKKELRYSLKTHSAPEAKARARLLAGQIQRLFRLLRRKGNYMTSELSEDQIQKIVKGYVEEALNDDESDRINGKTLIPETLEGNLHVYDSFLSDYREALVLRDNRPIEHLVNTVLKEAEINIPEDSSAYRKLRREMLKAQITV